MAAWEFDIAGSKTPSGPGTDLEVIIDDVRIESFPSVMVGETLLLEMGIALSRCEKVSSGVLLLLLLRSCI